MEARVLLSTAYAVTDLGGIHGLSVNNSNQVAVYVDKGGGVTRPAVWSNGKLTLIPAPGDSGQAQGIDDAGDVVG